MGAIRLYLAVVVVLDHLRVIIIQPAGLNFSKYLKLGMTAGFAVMFFFIISGFLISTALAEKYPPTWRGTVEFYKSRFVRIFSLYWPAVILFLVVLSPYARDQFATESAGDLFTRLFLIGADWRISFADYPQEHWGAMFFGLRQAWTLGPELSFYLLAPFLLRSPLAFLVVLVATIATRAYLVAVYGYHPVWTYYFLPATFVFFQAGAVARFAGSRLPMLRMPIIGIGCLVGALACLLYPAEPVWDSSAFWIAAILFAISLPGIFEATKSNTALNWLGSLSFPVYLLHLMVIILASDAGLFAHLPRNSSVIILVGVSIVLVVAILANWLIERPTAHLMRRVLSHPLMEKKHVRPKSA